MELDNNGKNKNEVNGVLFKDIVKQHIQRENELENEIRQLKDKIKSTSTPMYDRMYNLFVSMRNHIELRLDSDGCYYISVHDCPLSNDEMEFVERQIRLADEQMFQNAPNFSGKIIESTSKPKSSWGFKTELIKNRIFY